MFVKHTNQAIPALLAGLFLAPLPAAAAACKPKIVDSVPLQLVNRHFVVHAQINGYPVDMMVDTGDSKTVVTAALVDKLGLPADERHWSAIGGVNGTSNPNYDVIIGDLGIAKFKVTNIRAMIDGQDLSTPVYQAVLGADVLLKQDIQFDFPNRLLTFYDPASCAVNLAKATPAWLNDPGRISDHSGRMLFNLFLNGHPLRAVLDTGANNTIVAEAAALKTGASLTAVGHGTIMDANGRGTAMQRMRFDSVRFGSEGFAGMALMVADVQLGEADAMVGLDYWNNRAVWISPSQQRIFVLQPSKAAPQLRTAGAD